MTDTMAPPKQFDPLPHNTRTIGMWLFLAALAMLFISGMVGYVIIRLSSTHSPSAGTLDISWVFALSTITLIAGSITIERAIHFLRQEKQRSFVSALQWTLAYALLFIIIQTPGLLALLAQHDRSAADGIALYGLIFVLILLHAVHVLGGIIPLVVTSMRAMHGRYDHENIQPIRSLAMYWHFLDAVWVSMLIVFIVLR